VPINRERNLTWDDVVRTQVSSGTLLTPRLPRQEHDQPRHLNGKAKTHQLMPGGRLMPLGCIPRHRVALIVPFRARDQHLTYFVNHLYPFLRSQLLDFIIIVVEQVHNSQLTIPTIPATPVLMLSLRFCDRVTLGYIMIMVIVTSGPSTSNLTKRPHRRRTWTVQSYSPGCASVHSSITHSSLGSPESKTASRSVQPFLQGSLR